MNKVYTFVFLIAGFFMFSSVNAQVILEENFENGFVNWNEGFFTTLTNSSNICPGNTSQKAQFGSIGTDLKSVATFAAEWLTMEMYLDTAVVSSSAGTAIMDLSIQMNLDSSFSSGSIDFPRVTYDNSCSAYVVDLKGRGGNPNFWVDTFPSAGTPVYWRVVDARNGFGGSQRIITIDSLIITGTPATCAAPTSPNAVATGSTTAGVSWSLANGLPVDNYLVVAESNDPCSPDVSMMAANNQTVANLTGLTGGVTYDVTIVSLCSNGDTSMAATANFTTTTSCAVPTSLSLDAALSTAASLSWTGAGSNYSVVYGPMGFDPCSAGTVMSVSQSNVTLTGLTANTQYDAYVRELCSASDSSSLSGKVTFSTSPVSIGDIYEDATIIKVFPTPAGKQIHISYISEGVSEVDVDLTVFDMIGKTYNLKDVKNGDALITLDIQNLPSGVYFISIEDEMRNIVKRFIKE